MEAAVEEAEGIKGELRLGHDLSNLAVLASSMPSQLPEMVLRAACEAAADC